MHLRVALMGDRTSARLRIVYHKLLAAVGSYLAVRIVAFARFSMALANDCAK